MSITLKKKAVAAVESVQDANPVEKVKTLRRFVPKAVGRSTGRLALRVQHKSPELLFAAGLVLGGATVVTACRSTLKLPGLIEDMESDLRDIRELHGEGTLEDDKARKMTAYVKTKGAGQIVKLYAPSLALGVMAVASLTGSHHIMSKRNVALTAAYAAVEKSLEEYRGRVKEKYGEETERELYHGRTDRTIVEDTDKGPKKVHTKNFGRSVSPYARVWDAVSSKNWKNDAYSNRTFILSNQNWANDLLKHRGHLFLNEVHDMLGLERTAAGQIVGWVVGNGDSYVDFGIFDRQHSDERVFEFMFGEEKSILLDFNVDGPVYKLLDELNTDE